MSDEPTEEIALEEWRVILGSILQLMILGVVHFEVHPSRWPLYVRACSRHGAPMPSGFLLEQESTAIPLVVEVMGKGSLNAALICWCPCRTENCPGCSRIMEQAAIYLSAAVQRVGIGAQAVECFDADDGEPN
jgi:hypothetical protein